MFVFSIILLIIVLIFVILLIMAITSVIKEHPQKVQEYNERLQQQNVLSETSLIHLGGHPYLQANDKIRFQIRNNNTIYFYKESSDNGEEIPISQLTRYEVKTESEIHKDVTLTRLLALGIFAFAVKKKTKIEEQYLILSYIQNGIEVNCILKRDNQQAQLGNVISTLNRLRIKENRREEGILI